MLKWSSIQSVLNYTMGNNDKDFIKLEDLMEEDVQLVVNIIYCYYC